MSELLTDQFSSSEHKANNAFFSVTKTLHRYKHHLPTLAIAASLITLINWNLSLSNKLNIVQTEYLELKRVIVTPVSEKNDDKILAQLQALQNEVIQYRAQLQGQNQVLGATSQPELRNQIQNDALAQSPALDETVPATPPPVLATAQQPASTPQSAPNLGTITLKNNMGWTTVDAHQTANFSSKIVGELVVNVSYPYIKKDQQWYQVQLAASKLGWIHEQYVQEE